HPYARSDAPPVPCCRRNAGANGSVSSRDSLRLSKRAPMQLTLALLLPLLVAAAPPLERPDAGSRAAQQAQTDLAALMARALEHRASAWKTLEQYILNEREQFELRGPLGVPLF